MLKIQSDRIIIDGHEPTKEQCETMTLLANALAGSESFKTVKYESGYAEFEKVGKADKLKFIPVYRLGSIYLRIDEQPQVIKIGSDALDLPSSFDPPTITIEKQKLISTVGSFAGITNFDYVEVSEDQTQLIIKDGYEIELVEYPDIVGSGGTAYHIGDNFNEVLNGTATYISLKQSSSASKVSIDLTTLPGWSSLSSGSHSITIVAKADGYRDSEPSAAVTVEKAAAGYTITINNIGDYGNYDIVGGPEAGTYEVGKNKGSHTYHNVTDMRIRPFSSCTISNGTGNFNNGEIFGLIEFSSDSTATLTWTD